jgi:hypothetical protein
VRIADCCDDADDDERRESRTTFHSDKITKEGDSLSVKSTSNDALPRGGKET